MTGAIVKDSNSLSIGAGDNSNYGDWYGYMYGLRISKGIARYSDNFTPGDPLEFNSSFTNRKKISITDANNNQLYTEIERWDHANKKAYIWTKVPTVASGTNTKLYFYYDKDKSDNTNYVGDVTSTPAQQVWDSNFIAVWHCSSVSAISTNSFKDSTSSGVVSTLAGGITSVNTNNMFPSLIGNGLNLERDSSQYINLTTSCSFKSRTQGTIEGMFTLESHPGSSYSSSIFWESTTSAAYTRFGLVVNGASASVSNLRMIYRDTITGDTGSPVFLDTDEALSLNTLYYGATTYNSDNENFKLFMNGVLKKTDTTTKASFSSGNPLGIFVGAASSPPQYQDGYLDEVRLSKIARSDAWIKATYYSNWNDLLIFGSIEELPYFFYEGNVTVMGAPSARKVNLYRRSTGQLVDSTTSSGTTGYFVLQSPFAEYHYMIVLPEVEEAYPILFDDKIHPEI
jgi:hypothetical protein